MVLGERLREQVTIELTSSHLFGCASGVGYVQGTPAWSAWVSRGDQSTERLAGQVELQVFFLRVCACIFECSLVVLGAESGKQGARLRST